jgi:hypothetical protein
LGNSWIDLDRVFLVPQSDNKGASRLVLPTRDPEMEPIRIYQTVSRETVRKAPVSFEMKPQELAKQIEGPISATIGQL